VNDVVYLNPADSDFPIAFNPLEAVDPKYKHLVASGLMGVFTKIWAGVWSARMEYILNNTILGLLDSPGNTLLGIARMLVNKTYRKKIVDNIKDPVVKSFWVDEFANYNDKFRNEAIAPIQNKVGQFLSSAIIRNIVGQTKSSIDLRDIMDNQKIFLINLSKGRIGEDSSALLGAMIITKLQLAAMSRVDMPEEERKDFYLYVDEFQNFATESFASILSEARKYRLNVIIAHQYIGQLEKDKNTVVRDAIFGNVGTMACFRVGADDAEFLEKEFDPTFLLNDLVNLPKYHIILKLMINGVASTPFSATTLPPIGDVTGNEEKVIKVSRERYASARSAVEDRINKWMGSEFHLQAAENETQAMSQDDVKEDMRYKETTVTTVVNEPQVAKTVTEVRETQFQPREQMQQSRDSRPPQREPERDRNFRPAPRREEPRFNNPRPRQDVPRFDRPQTQSPQPRPEQPRFDKPRVEQPRPPKPAPNPIWDTVNKLTEEKIQEVARTVASSITQAPKPPVQTPPPAPTPIPPPQAPAEAIKEPQKPEVPPAPQTPPPSVPVGPSEVLKPGDKIQF
jgi:hypothetical protein